MKLIVGLGNPGKEYSKTRHNIGFMVIDHFAKTMGYTISKEKFNGLYEIISYNDEKIILLKPLSYMNLSGEVVSKFVSYYNINIDDILVISDDLNLDFLRVRLRPDGSSGGHNGLKNIALCLNSSDYKRLRIGIGSNNDVLTKDYVLGNFSSLEIEKIDNFLDFSDKILTDFICINFSSLMNLYNKR